MAKKEFRTIIAKTEIDKQYDRFTPNAMKKACERLKDETLEVNDHWDYNKVIGQASDFSVDKEGNISAKICLFGKKGNIPLSSFVFRIRGMLKEITIKKNKGIPIREIRDFEILEVAMILKHLDVYRGDKMTFPSPQKKRTKKIAKANSRSR